MSRDTFATEEALLEHLVAFGRRAGAHDVEIELASNQEFSAEIRLGEIERLVEAGSRGVYIRVTVDQRVTLTRSSDLSRDVLETLVKRAVERAALGSQDPYAGPPDEFGEPVPAERLDLFDPSVLELSAERKIEMALEVEKIALNSDSRITNSLGSWMSTAQGLVWFANSRGVSGHYQATLASVGVGLQAGETDERVEEFWWSNSRHLSDLEDVEKVARRAVQRTVRQLGARKLPTTRTAVIFEPRMTGQLLAFLASCVNGMAVYRQRSCLAGKLGQKVVGENIHVVDDALRPRGLGSRPFDSEGVATRRLDVVRAGVLNSYLLNAYSARRLGLKTTGHASGQGVSVHNFYLEPGDLSPEEIIRSTERGLLLTRTIGHGTNPTTGELSKGAYGLWIEGGEIAYPVAEITIAGNLLELLSRVDAIGNDLEFRSPIAGPTIRVQDVTVGGR